MKRIFAVTGLVILLATQSHLSRAQWVQTNGPYGGYIWSIVHNDKYIFAFNQFGDNIFRSSDSGRTWACINNAVQSSRGGNLFAIDSLIFASTVSGVLKSKDNGNTWASDTSLPNFWSYLIQDSFCFLGTDGGLYRSSDRGNNWQILKQGLGTSTVSAPVPIDTMLFAASSGIGIYRSSDKGLHWDSVQGALFDSSNLILTASGKNLLASTQSGNLFTSTDFGSTWNKSSVSSTLGPIFAILAKGNLILARCDTGIVRSTDAGKTWDSVDSGLSDNDAYSFDAIDTIGTMIIVGTQGGGIFISSDNGISWNASNIGISYVTPGSFAFIGSNIFAGVSGVALSTDSGKGWYTTSTGLTDPNISGLATIGSKLFATTLFGNVLESIDSGVNWKEKWHGSSINCLAACDTILFIGTQDSGIYRSDDEGNSWKSAGISGSVSNLIANRNTVLCTINGQIFYSSDQGSVWNSGDITFSSNAITIIKNTIFAGGDKGLFASTDDGISWELTSWTANDGDGSFLNDSIVSALGSYGDGLFLGTIAQGIFLSGDLGKSWMNASSGLPPNAGISDFGFGPKDVFVGIQGNLNDTSGVWRRPLSDFGISAVSETLALPLQIQSYPNPFSSQATIAFTSPNEGYAEVTIVNLLGSQVGRLFAGELAAGEHSFAWSASNLPPGMYECVVNAGGYMQRIQLVHVP